MTASLGGLLTVGDLLPEMALYKVTAPCVESVGCSWEQIASAHGQRGWKRQPDAG